MLALFIIVAFSISLSRVLQTVLRKWYLPAASFGSAVWGFWIEDMIYFATIRYNTDPAKREVLDSTAWVNWILGGNKVFGSWIPNMYLLLCAGGFAFFATAFVVSRKDLVMKMAMVPKRMGPIKKIVVTLPFLILMEIFGIVAVTIINVETSVGVQIRIATIFLVVTVPAILTLVLTDMIVRRLVEPIQLS
jgi:hypothetical protein